MAPRPAGAGLKGFYRQTKKSKGGVANPSASTTKRSKSKPQQRTQDESHDGEVQKEEELRRFDMDMAYGPCIGVTRLRRWERVAAMGLRPPPHFQELLLLRAPADSSPSTSFNKSQPTNSAATLDSCRSSSASMQMQLESIWAGKI